MRRHAFAVAVIVSIAPIVGFGFAGAQAPTKQWAAPHILWLRIEKVTPVEGPPEGLLKLDVVRHYGKISRTSSELAHKYETQRFSILFPAMPGASVKPGDLIHYDFEKYTSFDDRKDLSEAHEDIAPPAAGLPAPQFHSPKAR